MLLEYRLFAAGYCTHPECMTLKGGGLRSRKYPALCALILHPEKGYVLFDTGYSPRFFEATRKWPLFLYPKITPTKINDEETLVHQLEKEGIKADEIKTIFLSHFHADHIAGVKDFPNATIICSIEGYEDVKHTQGFKALRKGFASELLPNGIEERLQWIEDHEEIALDHSLHPFGFGRDIFGDESMIAIALPGHARGQYGLIFQSQQLVFLVADCCWSSAAYRDYRLPSNISYIVQDQKKAYEETLLKLHHLHKNNPDIRIIPSHCDEIWQEIEGKPHAR